MRSALSAEAAYAQNNNESTTASEFISPVLGDTPKAVLDGLLSDQAVTDEERTALENGISLQMGWENPVLNDWREDYCTSYRASRDDYQRRINEVILSIPPMLAAKAGYAAAVEVYGSNESCSNLMEEDYVISPP